MPGWNVSAKLLNHLGGNIDAVRHNSKRLLRTRKETGRRDGSPAIMRIERIT
jgi:hypothetical protein